MIFDRPVIYGTSYKGKLYVGKHIGSGKDYVGSGIIISNIIKSGKEKDLITGVIEYVNNKEQLNEREKYWIKKLKPELNLTDGGEGASNVSKQRLKKHNPRFNGKKHSKNVIDGIKKRMKGYTPYNAIKSRSKSVYCGFTNKEYKSISDCARDLNVSQSFISNMINGKRKNKFNVEVK